MDLSEFKPKTDTFTVALKSPRDGSPLLNDKKEPMTITVYGPYSKQFKAAYHEQANSKIQKAYKNKDKAIIVTSEEIEQSGLDMVSKITSDWTVVIEGKTPKVTLETAKQFYQDFPWAKVQVEEAVEAYSNFLI